MSGTFRLGVVLRLREMAEDAARARLATAVGGHREATERLIELTVAEEATAAGRRKLETASEVLMQARSSLAEASKRREVVERLRDRMHAAEAQEAQHREDNLLSEIAGVRHARALSSHEVEP